MGAVTGTFRKKLDSGQHLRCLCGSGTALIRAFGFGLPCAPPIKAALGAQSSRQAAWSGRSIIRYKISFYRRIGAPPRTVISSTLNAAQKWSQVARICCMEEDATGADQRILASRRIGLDIRLGTEPRAYSSNARAALAQAESSSVLAPPTARAPTTAPSTQIGKPPPSNV